MWAPNQPPGTVLPGGGGQGAVRLQRLLLLLSLVGLSRSFNFFTQPRSYTGPDELLAEFFPGNRSHVDHFRLLQRDGDAILIGARNYVYNISVVDLKEHNEQRIVWRSTKKDSDMCFNKGKSESDCQNYVRVLAKEEEGKFLVCGTNAYKPRCRRYLLQENNTFTYEESNGIGKCPFDPKDNSTFVFTNKKLYSGTVANFQGTVPLIFADPLQTDPNDYQQLNAPDFVSSFAYKDLVFFLFRETAVEYMNCGKRVYSRVARVCKDDRGSSHSTSQNSWTSFLKSRLNCSIPGEYPFYFDEIHASSDVVTGKYGGSEQDLIYTLFRTSVNSIPGSAVCVFSMRAILDTFEGAFKHQESLNANWLPVPSSKVPEPRPGSCVEDSRKLPEETIDFVRRHPLMDEAVPAFYGQPLLVRASFDYRFTKIAVDPQVPLHDSGGGTVDVLFLATDTGVIIKAVNVYAVNSTKDVHPVIIEEVKLFKEPTEINNLQLVMDSLGRSKLIVITDDQVTSLEVHRCHKALTCSECVGLQDPYCVWDEGRGKCSAQHEVPKGPVFQNITSGVHYQCHYSDENLAISQSSGVQTTESPFLAVADSEVTCAPCVCPEPVQIPSLPPPQSSTESPLLDTEEDPQMLEDFYRYGKHPWVGNFPRHYPTRDPDQMSNEIVHGDRTGKQYSSGFMRGPFGRQDNAHIAVTYVDKNGATGPVISASTDGPPVYSAETLAIAVTTACVATLVLGFILGFLFSRRCKGDDFGHSETPYLDSKFNKMDNLMPSADPNMYMANNKQMNNLITSYNPKNVNGKSSSNGSTTTTTTASAATTIAETKLVKPAKCAYI